MYEEKYDDDNIPEIDLPEPHNVATIPNGDPSVQPLPESERPRQDGPGGN